MLLRGDPKDFEDQQAAVEKTLATFGRLDVTFANAGRGISQPGTEAGDPAEWRDVIDVNVIALLWTAKLTLPQRPEPSGLYPPTARGMTQAGRAGS